MSRYCNRPFFVLLLAALLSACATPFADFDDPEIDLAGFRPLPSNGMEARFLLQLRILNPNAVPLRIDGMHYELFLREQRALSGVNAKTLHIPAYSERKLELEAAAGMLGSFALLRDLLVNPPDSGLPYTLRAKLSIGGTLKPLRIERAGTLRMDP